MFILSERLINLYLYETYILNKNVSGHVAVFFSENLHGYEELWL